MDILYPAWIIGIPLFAMGVVVFYGFADEELDWYGLVIVSVNWPNMILLGLLATPWLLRMIFRWGR